ncbi:MAG: hypothetical protein IPN42_13435 [Methylococcaceae bacterium]|nr:hypothetical protein [Methylococcaceae bacterium]
MLLGISNANAGNRAVEIDIGGIGPAVDAAAFETVRQVVGHAVATGTVDKFIVKGYGIEGGFSACAQAAPGAKPFGSFVKQLNSIKPNRNTTAYSVRPVAACTDEDQIVFCTQEVKMCPDGITYVGRIAPGCGFAPCPGEK